MEWSREMAAEKVVLKVDPDALTIGDLEDFEDVVGASLFEALKPIKVYDEDGELKRDEKGRPATEVNMTAKALKALIWITQRVDRPDFTLQDARNVRVTSLEIVEDSADPEGNDESGVTD